MFDRVENIININLILICDYTNVTRGDLRKN